MELTAVTQVYLYGRYGRSIVCSPGFSATVQSPQILSCITGPMEGCIVQGSVLEQHDLPQDCSSAICRLLYTHRCTVRHGHRCNPAGQQHQYWAHSSLVRWLSADPRQMHHHCAPTCQKRGLTRVGITRHKENGGRLQELAGMVEDSFAVAQCSTNKADNHCP